MEVSQACLHNSKVPVSLCQTESDAEAPDQPGKISWYERRFYRAHARSSSQQWMSCAQAALDTRMGAEKTTEIIVQEASAPPKCRSGIFNRKHNISALRKRCDSTHTTKWFMMISTYTDSCREACTFIAA